MITYSRLAAKIWRLVDYFEPALVRELKYSDFEQLDREILEWYDSIPEEIKSVSMEDTMATVPSASRPYDMQRLRIWTRLRLNQVRVCTTVCLRSNIVRFEFGSKRQSYIALSASKKIDPMPKKWST